MTTIGHRAPDLRLIWPLVPSDDEVAEPVQSPPPFSEAWERLAEEIRRIGALSEDWDGQGAAAPARPTVDWALDWVQQMRHRRQSLPPSQAVAGVAGEIYLEWQGDSFYLVAELASPAHVEWTLSLPGQPNRHWSTDGAAAYFVSRE